ncbi:hypothetical protein ABIE26_001607 [Pedobacter africanus]|uniref:Uncharacterized protein n=1 Tax=Pedobacter africanus TaxID=151894 RepID=A0ACC6KRW9_9SPHI|nr:hypothetical protein [Pedobacter africanus]
MTDILSIIFGRWLLGAIGYCLRKLSYFTLNIFGIKNSLRKGRKKSKAIIFDDYQNIITGFTAILILIIIVTILKLFK